MSINPRPMGPDRVEGLAHATSAGIRPSWRVNRVAADLDVHHSQVRKLLREGKLEGHIVGKWGIRIYVDSVIAYQEAMAIGGPPTDEPTKRRRINTRSPRFKKAMDTLRDLGCV